MSKLAPITPGEILETPVISRSLTEHDRIQYIDVARCYAMAMVFFGHFVERLMLLDDPFAATLYRFIYAFHMVLFFVLSGFIAKPRDLALGAWPYFKYRCFARLLPFVFFTLLFMGLAAIFPGDFFNLKLPSLEGYRDGLWLTARGIPMFCVPSWFLLMLFSVEMIHYFFFRMLGRDAGAPGTDLKIFAAIPAFYIAGYFLNLYGDFLNLPKQRTFNLLFVHEAVTMYAFYLTGLYFRRRKLLIGATPAGLVALGAAMTLLIVLLTFNLNQGPFNFNYHNAVVILMSSHGHIVWFPLTALAGSLFVFFLGKITPARKTIVWMGQHTLILMCLNGVFYHYINPGIARWVFARYTGQPGMIFLAGLIVTVVSLALCIPCIYLLNRYLPQLTGKPKVDGPWLKALVAP